MKTIFSSFQTFISHLLTVAVLASGICLFAGEIRLAALKKASQGSSKLLPFTQHMTNQIMK